MVEKKKMFQSRQIFDSERMEVRMSNGKVTYLPTVTRLFPPKPAFGPDEMKIQDQSSLAKEAFAVFRARKRKSKEI